MLYVFAACVIPVFAWAILTYLDSFPAFALRLTVWDLIGTASYVLAFALFESAVILAPLILLAVVLPPRLLKSHFVAVGSIIILISSLWAMLVNYGVIALTLLDAGSLVFALAVYVMSIAIPVALALRYRHIEQIIQGMMQRLAVLAYIYVGLACLGAIIVLVRNL